MVYASHALTPTECHYAQIEKELLAIVFGLERFHYYTYGVPITVDSDHKPLEMIAKKSLQEAPKCLQRMLLRLQQYDVTINYQQGKNMHIADTLSRAYLSETEENLEVLRFHEELENLNMVQNLPVPDEAKNAIRVETSKDEDLQALVQVVQKSWPEMKAALPAPVKPYFQLRDELSVQDGVLFRGNRVIIPRSMRADAQEDTPVAHWHQWLSAQDP